MNERSPQPANPPLAIGDTLAYQAPPEPPPGSVVQSTAYDWEHWTRTSDDTWNVGILYRPDVRGLTWDDVLHCVGGSVTVIRIGWPQDEVTP